MNGTRYIVTKIRKHAWLMTFCSTITIFIAFLMLCFGVLSRSLVSNIGNHINVGSAMFMAVMLSLSLAFFSSVRSFFTHMLADKCVSSIKKDIYKRMLSSARIFSIQHSSILENITKDCGIIHSFFATHLTYSIRNIIMLLGSIVAMLYIYPKITIAMCALISAIVTMLLIGLFFVSMVSKIINQQEAQMFRYIQNVIESIKTINIFGGQGVVLETINKDLDNVLNINEKKNLRKSITVGMMLFVTLTSIIYMLYYGAHNVAAGLMDAKDMISFFLYTILTSTSLIGLSDIVHNIAEFRCALNRIADFIFSDQISEVGSVIIEPKQDIKFCNIGLVDQEGHSILRDVNFTLKHGIVSCIYGPSGVGKSTIIDILLGFIKPTSGVITVGDDVMEDINLSAWRHNIAVSLQCPHILYGTLLDNIVYVDGDVDIALKLIDMFSLQHILNTRICHGLLDGLSHGEKQRINIARCLARIRASIMIFDESISGLDYDNCQVVKDAIKMFAKNKTVLFVTHQRDMLDGLFDDQIEIKSQY